MNAEQIKSLRMSGKPFSVEIAQAIIAHIDLIDNNKKHKRAKKQFDSIVQKYIQVNIMLQILENTVNLNQRFF